MAEVIVPSLTNGRFTLAGVKAVQAVSTGVSYNAASPEFGADPFGVNDSTAAIQAAVDKAAAAGGGVVYLPGGTFKVSYPFVQLKSHVVIDGAGPGTRVFIDASKSVPSDGGEVHGVFHTGSYLHRLSDSSCARFGVRNLMIMSRNGGDQHQSPIPGTAGIIFNTDLGENPADPDAVPVLSDVEIWDMEIGAAIIGNDDQGMKVHNLRIRRCLRQGLLVGKPSDHPEVIAKVKGGPGAADNKFIMADVSGANISGGGYAGIEVHTSQTKFFESTSWYNKRVRPWQDIYGLETPKLNSDGSLAGAPVAMGAEETAGATRKRNWQHDGAGWLIKSTKNIFIGCTAQENGGHGWFIQWGKNQFVSCLGESSSFYDTVSKAAKESEAAQFYVCNDAKDSLLLSCRAENARDKNRAARWGYYIESYIRNLRVTSCSSTNHPENASGVERKLCLGKTVLENVSIDIDTVFHSTLPRESGLVHEAELRTREAKHDYRSHLRSVLVPTYIYPDYFKPTGEQQYLRLALAADVMPFIIINPNSGPGDGPGSAQYTDFTNQLKKNRGEFGQKIFGYIRTGASLGKPRPVEELYAEVEKYLKWYDVDGIFWDEAYNGWGDQKGKEVYHQNIAAWMNEHYPWMPTVVNPGANTTADMVGTGWYMMTFEQEASEYLTNKYLVQEHYKGQPRQMFWHCIHDVASFDQAVKVLRLADTLNVANLYLTDDTIWETVNGQRSRTANPYDRLPSEWLWKLQIAWARDRLDEYLNYISMVENQLSLLRSSGGDAKLISKLQDELVALKGA